ncbi:EamA family transporter [Burkholderia gladioli]|uniref:EamA family transporter n=1 Tax=Burkholderia gladioli TaxID=28095 RepID=UPI00163E3BFF|nr:EamA family transporter [Burkholderia gladioli]
MKLRDTLLAILVTAIWGLNFSVIKLGLQSTDPFVLAGIRFTLSALPAVLFIRRPAVPLSYLAAYGLLFGVGLWGIVNLGIQAGLSAGIASLVLQFSAFLTILLGAAVFREAVSRYQFAGIAIALLGLACVIAITDGSATPAGIALVIVGALAWSGANLVIKLSGTREVLAFLVWSSLFSPLPLFAIAWLQHGAAVYAATFTHVDGKAVFSILFQVYPTTLFGYGVWNLLLRKYPVSTVAPLSLLVPIFGMLGSALIFGEPIGTLKLLATALIVLGLAVGLYGKHLGARLARQAGI